MLECNLMDFYGEGHSHLDPMCLGKVIFSAKELTKEPTAANEAAFLAPEKGPSNRDVSLTKEFLKDLQDFVGEFRKEHALN